MFCCWSIIKYAFGLHVLRDEMKNDEHFVLSKTDSLLGFKKLQRYDTTAREIPKK